MKPIGSFEWGILLAAGGVVGAIVVSYAAVSDRGTVAEPVRAEARAAIAVAEPRPLRSKPAAPVPPARRPTTFALTAARASSWLSVRAGAESARVLYEGVLAQGETVRFRAPRLWLRFGAASHLDLTIDGRLVELPLFGTFDAFAGPRGVRPDPTPYATAAQSP
ncbi:MAG TPA: DUF4115 domain-containing protein [Gaiellaceae bacterium]|nr:DUF4115 domain-containing protein [Gaiellaceae bacterium]